MISRFKSFHHALITIRINNYFFQSYCCASTDTNKPVSSISSQNDLSTLNVKDKRKEEYLNPKSVIDPEKDKFQTISQQNNIKLNNSSYIEGDLDGGDKTIPEFSEIGKQVKNKAEALKDLEVEEHELKPDGGFKTVPINNLSQEVGFNFKKVRDASKDKLRKETGVGCERNINTVPEKLRKVEDYFDVAKTKTKEFAENVKEKTENVLEKIKITATEISEKSEEKEKKEKFKKNLEKTGQITGEDHKDERKEVSEKVD